MKNTSIEISTFRATVKAIGVYHLFLGVAEVYRIILRRAGFPFALNYNWQYELAWTFFYFAAAAALLFGTDTFCRLAFRPEAIAEALKDDS